MFNIEIQFDTDSVAFKHNFVTEVTQAMYKARDAILEARLDITDNQAAAGALYPLKDDKGNKVGYGYTIRDTDGFTVGYAEVKL